MCTRPLERRSKYQVDHGNSESEDGDEQCDPGDRVGLSGIPFRSSRMIGHFGSGDQPIPHFGNGLDHRLLDAEQPEMTPQARNDDGQRFITDLVLAPDRVEEFRPTQDPSRALPDKHGQYTRFARSQVTRNGSVQEQIPGNVEANAGDPEVGQPRTPR